MLVIIYMRTFSEELRKVRVSLNTITIKKINCLVSDYFIHKKTNIMIIDFIKSKEALLILTITVLSYMSAISFEYVCNFI